MFSPQAVERLARACFGEPTARRASSGELRFRRRGSLAVDLTRGVFMDYEAGVGGGVLRMIVHAGMARTTAEAVRFLEGDGLFASDERRNQREQRGGPNHSAYDRQRASAAALWAGAHRLEGTVGEIYLRRARAIGAPLGDADLRFLGSTPPYALPALIARVSSPDGIFMAVHRTFLQPDGSGKAGVANPKLSLAPVLGGFIRLQQGVRPLIVAEGIESSLSAWEALGRDAPGFGCIASISSGGMASLRWPQGTDELVIALDRDAAGERAAQALARRASAAGLKVGVMSPPEGLNDWNDWARARRGGQ